MSFPRHASTAGGSRQGPVRTVRPKESVIRRLRVEGPLGPGTDLAREGPSDCDVGGAGLEEPRRAHWCMVYKIIDRYLIYLVIPCVSYTLRSIVANTVYCSLNSSKVSFTDHRF